jgi:hypothetical protein
LTPTPTRTLHRSSGGCCKTLPLQPCCYAAARRQRPPRSDEKAINRRCCSKRWRRNKRRARPHDSARSVGGKEPRPCTARICLLPSIGSAGREAEPRHRWSGAALGPTATHGTPSRPDGGLRAATTTATIARATMTIVDAGGATTATMTVTADGRGTKGAHGLLARASATRSSLRASAPQPTC